MLVTSQRSSITRDEGAEKDFRAVLVLILVLSGFVYSLTPNSSFSPQLCSTGLSQIFA